jgi:hypothetical protein
MENPIIITSISLCMTILSALAAWFAYRFSIKAHKDTLSILLPKERPLIVLIEEIAASIYTNCNTHNQEFQMRFKLKNIGSHPATNLIVKFGLAEVEKRDSLHETLSPITVSNTFYQETEIPFSDYFSVEFLSRKVEYDEKLNLLLYIRLNYEDKWCPDKSYSDDFYLIFSNEFAELVHATNEIKMQFKAKVDQVFGSLTLCQ